MGKMIHEQLSRSIIGAAMEVLNELKPGLDEKLYERALARLAALRARSRFAEVLSGFLSRRNDRQSGPRNDCR